MREKRGESYFENYNMTRLLKCKCSQVTIFVIIAVMIIVGIVLFFYLKNRNSSSVLDIPDEIQPVYNSVQDCLKEAGKNAMIRIGKQGGYFFITQGIPSVDGKIPYYFYNGDNLLISRETLEKQISLQIEEYLYICLNNFSELKNNGFSFDINDEASVISKINDNLVSVTLNYHIFVHKREVSYALNSFETSIKNIRISEIYDLAEKISGSSKNNEICLTCLFKFASDYKLSLNIEQLDDETLLFVIEDFNIATNSSYKFQFAGRYGSESTQKNIPEKITVPNIPNMTAYVGKEFDTTIVASGEGLSYEDYSPLFEISKEGAIKFTPVVEDVGTRTIWIAIKDKYNNQVTLTFNLEVI